MASLAGSTSSSNTFAYSTRIATTISVSSLYVTVMGKSDGSADYDFSVVHACNGTG